jgi:hypothetical protein
MLTDSFTVVANEPLFTSTDSRLAPAVLAGTPIVAGLFQTPLVKKVCVIFVKLAISASCA